MRCLKIMSLISSTLISSPIIAGQPHTINSMAPLFSPYVDLTLNTHWDPVTQDMEPMDLVSPATTQGIKAYHLAFITDLK